MILISLCALTAGFVTHPQFAISNIHYDGTQFISKDQLHKHCSALIGKNILCPLFIRSFSKTILNRFPQIAKIRFQPKFPNTVTVQVEEKSAWVSFVTDNGHYMIAEDGTILNRDNWNPNLDLDKLVFFRGVPDQEFQSSFLGPQWVKKARQVVENLQFYLPAERMHIEFKKNRDVVLIKDDVLPVQIGSMEYLDLKFRNLKYFLKQYGHKLPQIDYIDLRVEDRVVVKYTSDHD